MKHILTIVFAVISTMSFGQGDGLYKFIGKNGKYGFINKYGDVKVKPEYLIVTEFSEGLCFVSKETITKGYKWICIDTIGKEIFDIKDKFPETGFRDGYAKIKSFTEYWFINKKGEKALNNAWKGGRENLGKLKDETHKPADSLIKFKQDSMWGFKNLKGEVVIEPKYHLADRFENGLCAVRIHYQSYEIANDYYLDAIINTKGEVVSEQPMHCYLGFVGDLIIYYGGFHFSGGVYYLDKKGQRVIPKE